MPYRPKNPEKYRDEDWLREQYQDKQLSTRDIAEKCDCANSTIIRWLDRHGIEKRSKSEAAKIRAERHPHTLEAGAKALKEADVNAWELFDEKEREAFRERLSQERTGEGNPMYGKTGSDHHNWKPDKAPHRFYSSKKWQETREEVLERDNHECQACGRGDELHVHHIIPISAGGERFDPVNLVTLCNPHHKEWEGLYLRPDTRGAGE